MILILKTVYIVQGVWICPLTSKTEVLQMPSATDVNLGYGFISPIYCSKAKKVGFGMKKDA